METDYLQWIRGTSPEPVASTREQAGCLRGRDRLAA